MVLTTTLLIYRTAQHTETGVNGQAAVEYVEVVQQQEHDLVSSVRLEWLDALDHVKIVWTAMHK